MTQFRCNDQVKHLKLDTEMTIVKKGSKKDEYLCEWLDENGFRKQQQIHENQLILIFRKKPMNINIDSVEKAFN